MFVLILNVNLKTSRISEMHFFALELNFTNLIALKRKYFWSQIDLLFKKSLITNLGVFFFSSDVPIFLLTFFIFLRSPSGTQHHSASLHSLLSCRGWKSGNYPLKFEHLQSCGLNYTMTGISAGWEGEEKIYIFESDVSSEILSLLWLLGVLLRTLAQGCRQPRYQQ